MGLYVLIGGAAKGQQFSGITDAQDTSIIKKDTLKEVVVTATRTAKQVDDVPQPMTVISSEEIKRRGMVRLDEILAEQTGLAIVSDHGIGIQMQGFDPQYTLIMIDGEPVIGRTSGTLELSRLTTANIDRIEILKGPASSLYGSEAMAGVINIITYNPKKGANLGLSGRYGTNNNTDLTADGGYRNDRLNLSAMVNRYSSDGYSLAPESGFQTVSPYKSYTFTGKVGAALSDKTNVVFSMRYFDNTQHDHYAVDDRAVSGDGTVKDLSIFPSITHRFSDHHFSSLRFYRTTYKTQSALYYTDNQELYDDTFFDQAFTRGEFQHDYRVDSTLTLTGGIGLQHETVEATRYDNLESFKSGYGYIQADWKWRNKINVIAGGRYDAHNVYQSQFSPKLAANYKFSDKFIVLASVSRGYKAPEFRQLYLNFTNAVVGYSVFGYESLSYYLHRLEEEGQIREILIDTTNLVPLKAESSWAYNLGLKVKPFDGLAIRLNGFRNNISNLIETQGVAIKTNSQSVYSYFNLNSVYTQGLELEGTYMLNQQWEFGGGLQYLEAKDNDVIDQIKAGTVYTRDATGSTKRVMSSEYGGLLNRSKYMANASVSYTNAKQGITGSIRWIYRGKYGIRDVDGNGILNRPEEYVKGYSLFNASVSKAILDQRLRLQGTVDNILDFTNKDYISSIPGRLFYIGVSYAFNK
ncbi:TonB-dependent receptor [Olivibacter ginsenosidimutans]|uniref:TonB-dependent receptor n=2 Tax=Olivibacter ginsenosidimutans TaxID=1176537 RepID=A0ABP9ARG3_9SPHI